MSYMYLSHSKLQDLEINEIEVLKAQLDAAALRLSLQKAPLLQELLQAMEQGEKKRPKEAVCYDETPADKLFLPMPTSLCKALFSEESTVTILNAFRVVVPLLK